MTNKKEETMDYHGKWVAISVFIVSVLYLQNKSSPIEGTLQNQDYDPCCAYPCENGGVCISSRDRTYTCDCTNSGHYGINCTVPTWMTALSKKIKPDPESLHKFITTDSWLWTIINNVSFLQKMAMKYIYLSRGDIIDSPTRYESDHEYITLNAFFDEDYFARTLPPVPEHCPTPMGVHGHKKLPSIDDLINKVFYRKEFKPEPHGSNLLFQYYAQHFTHQFFRTDYKKGPHITTSKGGVDVSNIYGIDRKTQKALRSGVDGKLLTMEVDGEDFPPLLKDVADISMDYPPHMNIPPESQFALGHPFFALLPGLFVYSTIWVREHNRVCDILKKEHPNWDDERLYHTTKLIITGEVIKITIEDYVKHLSQYKLKLTFDPELIHGTRFQFHNKIHSEFDHLYHWHPLVPDGINVNGTYYHLMQMAFKTEPVFKHGIDNFIKAMATTPAGALTHHNHPPSLNDHVLRKFLENERKLKFQGINAYRKRFGMRPFTSFYDMTGDVEFAALLEELYGHIDAVEYYVGLISERPGPSVTPLAMVNIGGPWSVKGLIANPICSPHWWKPSTFGGDVGFDIIKNANLKDLFCKNMKSSCEHIAFALPGR